ncbi:TIGR03016 family PEP-CTERM system-associated outer membrane protein [Methylocaldum sp. MU1018]
MDNRSPKPDSNRILPVSGSRVSKELLFGLPLILHFSQADAVDWRVEPFLTAREIYSDNINLGGQRVGGSERRADDAFVTEISPGISIRREGRSQFRLNYRMQNLFYAGTDANPRINNQMQMNSNTELWDDAIFLNSTSTMGQYNGSTAGRFALDNISRTGNTSDYRTFRMSPYWLPHFGGYAEGIVRVTYGNIGGANIDSNILEERVDLRSGNWFDTVAWRANFYNYENQRDNGNGTSLGNGDINYQNYNGEVRYRLTQEISAFIQGGNFSNDFSGQSRVSRARNGSYWTAGMAWSPSSKFTIQGGAGLNNYFGALSWEPTKRTAIRVIYRNSDVGGVYGGGFGGGGFGGGGFGGGGFGGGGFGGGGFGGGGFGGGGFGGGGFGGGGFGGGGFGGGGFGGGGFGGGGFGGGGFGGGGFGGGGFGGGGFGGGGFGGGGFGPLGGFNAGSTWNALLTHWTRRTMWYASYGVITTTIQQVLLDQDVLVSTDSSGTPISDPTADQSFLLPIDQPVLTDEVITRERGQVGVSGHSAKGMLALTAYQENRSYQFSGDQDVLGFTASLGWRFAARTYSMLRFLRQSTDNQGTGLVGDSENQLTMMAVSLNRNIWTDLIGSVEFRHLQQTSDRSENEYKENRVTASLNMRF